MNIKSFTAEAQRAQRAQRNAEKQGSLSLLFSVHLCALCASAVNEFISCAR